MRLSVAVLTAALVTGSLVACSNGYGVPQAPSISADGSASQMSVAPVALRSSSILATIHAAARHGRADAVTPGIYAANLGGGNHTIYAYPDPDSSNGPPVCSVGPLQNELWSLAVDRKGDLLVATQAPASEAATVTIFQGPGLCGPELGSITDQYVSTPVDVASRDAQKGRIVVGSDSGVNGPRRGGVTVCTLSGGCSRPILTPTIKAIFAVAIAPNGDCWASGWTGFASILGYFAQCRRRGVVATGYPNDTFGNRSLDIDGNGNLVTISDLNTPSLVVYSGCNPKCKLVGGPFQLKGGAYGGHLDASSTHFVAVDGNQLDVYTYSISGVKYEYSVSNGIPPSGVGIAAFSPASKE